MASVPRVAAIVIALLIGAVIAYAGLRLVGEEHKQSCVAEAEARYPVVVTREASPPHRLPAWMGGGSSGGGFPAKVLNVAERQAAVESCEASIF